MVMKKMIELAFKDLRTAAPDSHKGQNGKLLIIGGSKLFHAASKWSLDVASKIVDMVFYSSVPENNNLIANWQQGQLDWQLEKEAKENFWDGIVVSRKNLVPYIEEADCILIGPGMERSRHTKHLVNRLLRKYPDKKWVVDAGALQMVKPSLLNKNHIITPHHQEMALLKEKSYQGQANCLLKGQVDQINLTSNKEFIEISGGNAGMTKGGTGDVLAGLVAALYCLNTAQTAMLIASYINKKAGDELYKAQGEYYNASELVKTVPRVLEKERRKYGKKL